MTPAGPAGTEAVPAFAAYLVVDWSAAAKPKTGADSVWIGGLARRAGGACAAIEPVNPRSRAEALERLRALLGDLLDRGRVLLGVDFPLGYPAGTAAALGLGGEGLAWRRIWSKISGVLDDAPDNANNRFAVAAGFNRAFGAGSGPFWGCPARRAGPWLEATKPAWRADWPAERRASESRVARAQPVWKLMGAGSCGSQALTGIPRLWALRRDPAFAFRAAVWPFETGFGDDPAADLVIAEVYPSLVAPEPVGGRPKDAAQVLALARLFAAGDEDGRLARWLSGPGGLDAARRAAVLREEGWILGVA